MTKEQALYFIDQELSRIEMIKLRSDLTDEQKLEAVRIGQLQFVSAGARRELYELDGDGAGDE
jgi:hypothetical protein